MVKAAATAVSLTTCAALAMIALAGCASRPSQPEPTFTITQPPSPTSEAGVLPKGSQLAAWAETALPENKPGGANFVARSSGELRPGMGAMIDLTQPAGQWVVTVVCQSEDGSPITLTAAPPREGLSPLVCSAPGERPRGEIGSIPFDGGEEASLTLTSDARAVFVYEISPRNPGQD